MLSPQSQVRYTLVRIVANVCVVQTAYPWIDEPVIISESLLLYVDAVARPLFSGLGVYCFLRKNTRFSENLGLHRWSRRTVFCMAFCIADRSFTFGIQRLDINDVSLMSLMTASGPCWVFACNALQLYITNLKLQVLGWHFTTRICKVVLVMSVGTLIYEILSYFHYVDHAFPGPWPFFSFVITVAGMLFVQCMALCWAATRALLQGGGDETIRCSAYCLYVNGVLAIAGPLLGYFSAVAMWTNFLGRRVVLFNGLFVLPQLPMVVVSLDVGLQVLGTLLLTGMIGPKGWERPMEAFRKLAHLSGFGLASPRIAWKGQINAQATECIVSFPGKYSAEWLRLL